MSSVARSSPTHPHRRPSQRLVKTFLAVAVLIVLSLVLTGCSSWREADVKAAIRSPGGTRISLQISTCNARLRSRVEETEREVHVLVTARTPIQSSSPNHSAIGCSSMSPTASLLA